MPDFTSAFTGNQLDAGVTDITDLFSGAGTANNLTVQHLNKYQSLNGVAATIDLIYVDAINKLHIGENIDTVLQSGNVLISETGTETVSPASGSEDLVIDGTGNRGMSIISGVGNISRINLGDSGNNNAGAIEYSNVSDKLILETQGANALEINSVQSVEVLSDFSVTGGFISIGPFEPLTISVGIITPTSSNIRVATEAFAATDDLDTITIPSSGDGTLLLIKISNDANDVTLTEAGNLKLNGGPFILSRTSDKIFFEADGSSWTEISRSDNDT